MGGGGSIKGMATSLSNNKKLLRRKPRFKKERSFLNLKKEYLKAAEGKLELKKLSKDELLKIRKKVILKRKKETYKALLILFISLLLTTYFMSHFFKNDQIATKNIETAELNKTTDKYLRLVSDADRWLAKENWHNAIFQYKKAQEFFPEDYAINYKLSYAYFSRCKYEAVDCNKALVLINQLLKKYPSEIDLLKLKQKLKYEID